MSGHADTTTADGPPLSPAGRRTFDRVPGPLWVLAALLILAQIVLTLAAVFGGGDEPGGDKPGAAVPSDHVRITYIVTGDRPSADVHYTTPRGDESHEATVLPFKATFTFDREEHVALLVSNRSEHGAGNIMCTILADGVVVQQAKASGEYANADCNGTAGEDKPLPGVPVPSLTPGAAPLPPESRLKTVVPVKDYPGRGSPVIGRVTDTDAHLSYAELGGKWNRSRPTDPMLAGWNREQTFDSEAKWAAQIDSGLVDGDALDQATGADRLRKVAGFEQDDRRKYAYVDGETTIRDIASQPLKVGGHDAWVLVSEMHFRKYGVKSTMDLSAVVVVDTGRPRPSVLWIALPETEKKLWPDINTMIDSLRVT
ncbi:hypothetical protein C3489_19265 [Streptomyces sp. Ru71]|uniref:hypothetical protein n=1 Tax=Streptomyces sp. Ru71 TaxID=2080746 RepID=UPI000CDCE948|nr:hypothetical protein [Streptomyces sp. Ru71]POX51849.1 hypothetical protein C3489_19265 [Streptomyces sp. Ru71]